jgi:putative hydrolase of the HAD superfamily
LWITVTGTSIACVVHAVLFDIDDTLVDFSGATEEGLRAYLTAVEPSFDAVTEALSVWRRLEREHYARYLAGELTFAGQRRARVTAFREIFGSIGDDDPDLWIAGYLRHCEASFRLFVDVVPALRRLAGLGYRLGALSNSSQAYQERKLTMLGVRDRFETLLCCDDAGGLAKPDPAMFRLACRRMALAPADVVYVGDDLDNDARAATSAGLTGVWLDRRGDRADDVPRIQALDELEPMLAG